MRSWVTPDEYSVAESDFPCRPVRSRSLVRPCPSPGVAVCIFSLGGRRRHLQTARFYALRIALTYRRSAQYLTATVHPGRGSVSGQAIGSQPQIKCAKESRHYHLSTHKYIAKYSLSENHYVQT